MGAKDFGFWGGAGSARWIDGCGGHSGPEEIAQVRASDHVWGGTGVCWVCCCDGANERGVAEAWQGGGGKMGLCLGSGP